MHRTLTRACLVFLCLLAGQAGRGAGTPGADWWAFQQITRPQAPQGRTAHPVDAFLAEALARKGLQPAAPASPREQLRRLHYDTLGLPPTAREVAAFEADPSDSAWLRQVDAVLARPEFGERWGRHWLDLVRYAESNGYERDGPKPEAWRYRDYVVRSFNDDKPYDQFVREQLAGDEIPGFNPDALIATGFYRLHVWDDEPDSTLAAEFDDLDDIMVTVSGTFLGMTFGCARCHDHKFDPISQNEYYAFLAWFRSINPYGLHHTGGGGRGTGRITRPLASLDELAASEQVRQREIAALRERIQSTPPGEPRRRFEEELRRVESRPLPFPVALAVHEDPVKPTRVFRRGDVLHPLQEVQPDMPRAIGLPAPAVEKPHVVPASSGRRTALARWISDRHNPLTARVMANRVWQHYFGTGLVPTPNDFGRTGVRPSHPELLDWLATELVAGDWRLKRLHRLILSSAAYRMDSRATDRASLAADEANTLLWRQNPRRLDAEALRDSLLAAAGVLNRRVGGPSFFPELSPEVHGTQDSSGKGWNQSPPDEQDRRSLYIFAKRALVHPLIETFDCPASTVPVGARNATTVAPQALMLLNDAFSRRQASRLAERVASEAGPDPTLRVRAAFQCVLQRAPTPAETRSALAFLDSQAHLAAHAPEAERPSIALTQFCAALLNLNEFLHVD